MYAIPAYDVDDQEREAENAEICTLSYSKLSILQYNS